MNKTILIIVIVVVLVAAGVAYFMYANQSPAYKPASAPAANSQPSNATPQTESLSASVSIKNFAFNPTPLTIKAGTTVTWTNNDLMQHKIKSNTFNSDALSNGQTFQFTFSAVGEYSYSCAIHPSMHGQIIVTQ
jgi:plastocyanin